MKLNINRKLLLSFGAVLVIVGMVNVYGMIQMNYLAGLTTKMYDHPLRVTRAVLSAHTSIIKMHRGMRDVVIVRTEAELENAILKVDADERDALEQLAIVREWILEDEGRVLTDETVQIFKGWKPIRDEVIALTRAGEKEQAFSVTQTRGADYVALIEAQMISLQDYAKSKSDDMLAESTVIRRNTLNTAILALAVALIISGIFAYRIAQGITIPLSNAVDVAGQIAAGKLQVSVSHTDRNDEIGELARSLSTMVTNLQNQMQEIFRSVNILAASITQISATTGQLTSNAAETATSVTETTTTIEEVRQTAQVSTQKAHHVSEISTEAVSKSQSGRDASSVTISGMEHVRQQMGAIAESIVSLSEQSQAIAEIIATVDDLAEQSNLLAVNAAIEAAKAGEQGKGFAVVAQEIKSLAEQSKQATTQVRRILADIQKATGAAVMATEQGSKAVDAGMLQASEAGEAILALADSVSGAAQAALQIAASNQEQLVGVDQVALAMENIKLASLQNLEGARQLEAATKALDDLAQTLKALAAKTEM